ncbi:MAG: hypothetical protein WCQ95_12180 [Bacteroidota bacterium]
MDSIEKFDNYEYNSDIGVAFIIIIPLNLIILFAMGLFFDLIKNRQARRNETKELK